MAAPRTLRNREFSFVRTLCDARFASQRKRRAKLSRRGEKDAAKFKDYLLPLLLLKRLSDVFDDEIDRLAEEYGDGNTALEIVEAITRSSVSIFPQKLAGQSSLAVQLSTGQQRTSPRTSESTSRRRFVPSRSRTRRSPL
jgi:hypothetical protein